MIPLPLDPKLGEGANPRHNELWAQAARVTRDLQDQIALKAPLASPTFTGTVTLPTPFTVGAVSVTSTGTELNVLDGVTSTTAELNILDGVTANAAEINLLDGITALAATTYLPTVSSIVNATDVAASPATYTRINNVVSVSGVLTMDTNTTSLVTMLLTLPVDTTLSGNDLHGSGAAIDAAAELINPVAVRGNGTSTPRAQMYFSGFTGDPNASPAVYYTFAYQVGDGAQYNGLRVEVVRAEQTVDGITDNRTFYFPTTPWVYYVTFMGAMQSGEEVTFTLGGSPAANISITGLFDRLGNGFDQTAVVEIDVDEYDAALASETFTISAETTISAITSPTINFVGSATPAPYDNTYFGTWAVQYVDATPPAVTTNSYPQYFTTGEYQRLFLYYGYVWDDVGLITWVVTQTAGTTRALYVAHNYGYQWNVTRDTSTDYAGTAYSLQAQYDGVDFGDPIVLTCEV